jgi:hypothetical protein
LLKNESDQPANAISHYDPLKLGFTCRLPQTIEYFNIRVIVRNIEQRSVLEYYTGLNDNWILNQNNNTEVILDLGPIMLNTGKYTISIVLLSKEGDYVYYRVDNVAEFFVQSEYTSWSDLNVVGNWRLK